MSHSIIVKKKVTNLSPSVWVNKDDAGKDVIGRKNIQVSLEGGYSFRTTEGDEMFADILDFIRIGMTIEVGCSSITPAPYTQNQSTESGGEASTTKYFMNLQDVVLIDFVEPVRNEKFADRKKKDDELVFAHKASTRGSFGKKQDKPEPSAEDDNVVY